MKTLRVAFQSLEVRNFRLFVLGQVLSATCTWMMIVAQDWLVLELSGNSGTALGTVTALQFTPVLLLTLYGGRLADRYDKRHLLILANLAAAVLSLALGTWVLTGGVRLWHLWLFALALGTVNAVEAPARISFVSEMVGGELLPNASAMSGAYFNAARVVGPAVAGLLIARLGVGAVVLVNAVSYLATVVSVVLIRPSELHRPARGGRPRRVRVVDGLRYIGRRPDLVLPMALVGVVGLVGANFQLTLPLLAKTEFHTGRAAFGLLSSSLAAGSLLAALATTVRRGRPPAGVVAVSAIAFGALEALAALAPGLPSACLLLALTGFAFMYLAQAANHRVQLGSDPAYRGRVMALYTLVFQGTTPLGALLSGHLAESRGVRWALCTGGLISLCAGTAALAAGCPPARRATRTGRDGPQDPTPHTADSRSGG